MTEYRRLAQHQDRDDIIEDYEGCLRKLKRSALVTAGLQNFSAGLGSCVFFWGLVVVLGGFGSLLRSDDFLLVATLVFLERFRGFSAYSVSKWMVNIKHPVNSANPKSLKYSDEHSRVLRVIRRLGDTAQLLLVLPGLLLSSLRLHHGQYGDAQNMSISLLILYVAVVTNCSLAVLAVSFNFLFSALIFPRASLSLWRYYHQVCHRAVEFGLAEADNFDFFAFVFRALAQDYSRNVQPLTVKKENEDLISYLYAHRKGAEVVTRYLESTDTWEQQAAANMVGFWASEKGISTHPSLLVRLVDKLGATQTGWAAANSLSLLAESQPLWVASVRSGDKSLIEVLAGQLDKCNPMSLVLMRTLISLFLHKDMVMGRAEEQMRMGNVEVKLREILYESYRQRTRAVAAYALMLVGKLTEKDKVMIGSIMPEKDAYFLSSERDMLEEVREAVGLGHHEGWGKLQVRDVKAAAVREQD